MLPALAGYIIDNEVARELRRARNARLARIRRTYNPLNDLPDLEFQNFYRVSKDFVYWLCQRLEPHLAVDGETATIPTVNQVLCTLRFFAVGSYQASIGESLDLAMSQPTVSRVLSNVTRAMTTLEHEFIKFPRAERERVDISAEFELIAQFPGIIGCIDGTHIPIVPPPEEKWSFLNHKRFFSLNIQVTCNYAKIITSLDIFAGAAHDSRIWRSSYVKAEMARLHAQGAGPYFLLGDSGYGVSPYIVTPFAEVQPGTMEEEFNIRHKHTRCLIERVFGELKGKWRCLKKERTMYYTPQKAAQFFKCCVILHNALIMRRDPAYEQIVPEEVEDDNLFQYIDRLGERELDEGTELRDMLVRTYCHIDEQQII